MKKQLEFHPEVTNDIKGSYLWYEDKLEGLGNRFLSELEDGYTSIQNFPDTWANFQSLYKVTEEKIVVVAVMHNSRKANYWLDRIS